VASYAEYPQESLNQLWIAFAAPGSRAGVLAPSASKSKTLQHWMDLHDAFQAQVPFMVNTPQHLYPLDVDYEHVQSGLGARLSDLLDNLGAIYVTATSGSFGWNLTVNLWSIEVPDTDGRTHRLELARRHLERILHNAGPFVEWNRILRYNKTTRPPLSPYPRDDGQLTLLHPTDIDLAIAMLNWCGPKTYPISRPTDYFYSLIKCTTKVDTRHGAYLSLALSLANSGYEEADFRFILENEFTPIGRQFQERANKEYNRSKATISRDLTATWLKALERISKYPRTSNSRRFLTRWFTGAVDIIRSTQLASGNKTKLIAFVLSVAHVAYRANTATPTIAESRLAYISGLSSKTINKYKKIGRDLGLWTISERYSHFGSSFDLNRELVENTDISSLYYLGDRDVMSVNHVNELHIDAQLAHLISTWEPHPMWRTGPPGGVKGHLTWSVIESFPGCRIRDLFDFLGFSDRLGEQVVRNLESVSLISVNRVDKTLSAHKDTRHWDVLADLGRFAFAS
jgi:hypothetical protein